MAVRHKLHCLQLCLVITHCTHGSSVVSTAKQTDEVHWGVVVILSSSHRGSTGIIGIASIIIIKRMLVGIRS